MSLKKDAKTCVCSWWNMLDENLLVYFLEGFFFVSCSLHFTHQCHTEEMLIQIVSPVLDSVLILSHGPFPKDLSSYFLCKALNE